MNIEATELRTTGPAWFKSSYSGGEGGACMEVANTQATVYVRDSKSSCGPQLAIGHRTWTDFIEFATGH